MNMVYQTSGDKVLCSVQEDFDRLEQWKQSKETITQTAVEQDGVIIRDNSRLKHIDGVIIAKTPEEIHADHLPRNLETLYSNYIRNQSVVIDLNLKAEMDKSEALVEIPNSGISADMLPFAKENGEWLELTYWGNPASPAVGSYYDQKTKLISMLPYESDPSAHGKPPHDFLAIRNERKAVLAGLVP